MGVADHPPPPDRHLVAVVVGAEHPSVEGHLIRPPAIVIYRRGTLLEEQCQPKVLPVERVGVPSHHVDIAHPKPQRRRLQQVGAVDVPKEHLGRIVHVPRELPPETAHDGKVVLQCYPDRVFALLVLPRVRFHVVVGAVDPVPVDVAVGVDVDARHVVDGHSLEPQPRQDQSARLYVLVWTSCSRYRSGVRVAPPLHDPVEVVEELP